MTFTSAAEEPKQRAPREEKACPWAPPPQHNFMKNWQRNLALWKRQQQALGSEQKGRAPPGLTCPQALRLAGSLPGCPEMESG